jgi:hypothetical protein
VFPLLVAEGPRTEKGDAANTMFGLPLRLADHKPGFDHRESKQETERGDNHRFRRSEKKDVPQESLASRIAKKKK